MRQLVTAVGVDESVIADNRLNRNVPLEMSVLTVGYRQGGRISHMLPPRPPLSLDVIYLCSAGAGEFTLPGISAISATCCGRTTCRRASCWRRTCSRRSQAQIAARKSGLAEPGDPGADHPAAG